MLMSSLALHGTESANSRTNFLRQRSVSKAVESALLILTDLE
jgi:hypothetical protein